MLNTAVYDAKLNALIERGAGANQEHNDTAVTEITAQIAELIVHCHREHGLVLHTDSDGYMHFVENGYSPSALQTTTYYREGQSFR